MEPIILTHDLTRSFDALTAVRRLNLAIAPGEIFGRVGPDVAGKTTTLRLALLVYGTGEMWLSAVRFRKRLD